MARNKCSSQSNKFCSSKCLGRILVVTLAYMILFTCWFFNVQRGSGLFVMARILSMRSQLIFWHMQSSKCSQSTIARSTYNVTSVKSCGNLLERLEHFNLALENIRNEMIEEGVLRAPFRNITPGNSVVTVHGTGADFFQQLHQFPQVRSIWLEFELNNVDPTQWKSTDDHSNLLIQKYYPLTATDPLCTWIETPGMTFHRYDLYFNRTCNRNISINMQPQNLRLTVLNDHSLEDNELPNKIFVPPDFVTYTQIIRTVWFQISEKFTAKTSLLFQRDV